MDRAKKAEAVLCKGCVSFHFRAHDLRRTAASYMGETGVDRFHIARVLNHRSVMHNTVTAIYDRYRYDNEKRAALEKWAEVLTGIVESSRRRRPLLRVRPHAETSTNSSQRRPEGYCRVCASVGVAARIRAFVDDNTLDVDAGDLGRILTCGCGPTSFTLVWRRRRHSLKASAGPHIAKQVSKTAVNCSTENRLLT